MMREMKAKYSMSICYRQKQNFKILDHLVLAEFLEHLVSAKLNMYCPLHIETRLK